jgi:hypothetical protein
MLMPPAGRRPDPRPAAKRTLIVAAALLLAATPGIAGEMHGGGGGPAPQQSGGQGGWGPQGGGGGWGPRHGGRSGYPGVSRWQDCHGFSTASRAAFRRGDTARGNALQDRFYDCMRSRWIR